jgi:hypothetical protein
MLPVFEFFLLLLFVSISWMCVYARVRSRKALAEDLRIERLTRESSVTTIRDAPARGRILVRGKVRGAGGARVTAPFTGDDALWARAVLQTNVGGVIKEWIESVEELLVDDDSGRTARVRVRGAMMRFDTQSVSGGAYSDNIASYLASHGFTPSTQTAAFEYQALLVPGDFVNVLATVVERDADYRSNADTLSLSADDGELIVFNPSTESGEAEKHRRYIGCAGYGIAVGVIGTVLMLYLVIRELVMRG